MALRNGGIRRVDVFDRRRWCQLAQKVAEHGPGRRVVRAILEPEQFHARPGRLSPCARHDGHELSPDDGSRTNSHIHTRCTRSTAHTSSHRSPSQCSFLEGSPPAAARPPRDAAPASGAVRRGARARRLGAGCRRVAGRRGRATRWRPARNGRRRTGRPARPPDRAGDRASEARRGAGAAPCQLPCIPDTHSTSAAARAGGRRTHRTARPSPSCRLRERAHRSACANRRPSSYWNVKSPFAGDVDRLRCPGRAGQARS